jgi:hypothetical protein
MVVDGTDYPLESILPRVPTDIPMFDDFSQCPLTIPGTSRGGGCVRVARNDLGVCEILSHGSLGETDEELRILTHVTDRRSAGESENQEPPCPLLCDVLEAAFADDAVVRLQRTDYSPEWYGLQREIGRAVCKVVRMTKTDTYLLNSLLPIWRQLDVETWHQILLKARAAVQARAPNPA